MVIRLGGCACRCAYCDARLHEQAGVDGLWEGLLTHLASERAIVRGVVVTGGEPLDDPDLPALLARLCDRGWPVRLHTNGSRPGVLRHAASEQLVSSVVLDVKTTSSRYDALTGVEGMGERVAESVELVKSLPDHEFRTTLFPGAVSLGDLESLALALSGGRLWALHQYRSEGTLDPRAVGVEPYGVDVVRRSAVVCRAYLPTVMRGFESG